MVGYQKNKLIINLLRLSALIWCPAAVYSYYPLNYSVPMRIPVYFNFCIGMQLH